MTAATDLLPLTLPTSWSAAWLPVSSGQHADEPLSARRLVLGWVLEPPVVTLLVLVAALYLWGVVRLARRGVRWGPGRSAAFLLGGLGTVAVATLSGLAAYDTVLLSTHMVQHMLLGMVAPIFLALGAPVTLLLRSLPPGGRRRTIRALHSRPARLLVNPLTGFVVFVASPVALYFTSWYPATLESETQHAFMHAHFLLAGCLFLWPVLGVDPLPVRLPHLARMGLVFAALPFHAFLGLAIMTGDEPLAAEHYSALHRDWGPSLEADQQWAGGLLWASGDLVALLILGALFVQWARADARDAARMDRHLDRLDQVGASAFGRPQSRRAEGHLVTHSPGTDRHPALVSVVAVSLAAMVLSGCASASEPGAGGGTPTSPASNGPTGAVSVEPTTDAVVVRLRVEDGKVTPVTHRVKVRNGQSVRLVVTADVADEVHVHGYDRHIDVEPGVAAAEEFVADQSGVFEVELEDAGIQLVQLEVR